MSGEEYGDLLLAAIVKLTEATALLNEIIRRRNDARRPEYDDFIDRKIDSIDFGDFVTARIWNMINQHNQFVENGSGGLLTLGGKYFKERIETVRDLIVFSEIDLLRTPNVGRRSVDRMSLVLAAHGLQFAPYQSRYVAHDHEEVQ